MILRLLLLSLLVAPLACAQEVEGMGASLSDWKTAHGNAICAPVLGKDQKPREGFLECRYSVASQDGPGAGQQLQGQQMAEVIYHFEGGKLVEIYGHFDSRRFATVRDALTEKLGKPSHKQFLTYRTVSGGKYPGEEVMWIRSKAIFQLTELSGTVGTSRLMILAK